MLNVDYAAEVVVDVYNLCGERVATLTGWMLAGRSHLDWNCGQVAAGIYVAIIRVNGEKKAGLKVAVAR